MTTLTGPKPISPKQVAFMNTLMNERVNGHLYVQTQLAACKVESIEALKSWQARNIIGVLLGEPKVAKAAPTVEEGYYFARAEEKVYRVVKAKSTGNIYAKVMVPPTEGKKKGSWVYAPGAMKNAATWEKLDAEAAAELGKKWGICAICGAVLTDDSKKYADGLTSLERGIGPVCAGLV